MPAALSTSEEYPVRKWEQRKNEENQSNCYNDKWSNERGIAKSFPQPSQATFAGAAIGGPGQP